MKPREQNLSLTELRQRIGRSQAEVALAVGTTQSGVSRLERQPDMLLSTLDEYVSALGGKLRLLVEHPAVSAELAIRQREDDEGRTDRQEYRVIWQDPESRSLVHVGWLEFTGSEFVFSYTDEARTRAAFEPFTAFPTLDQIYRSPTLFPFFAARIASAADKGFEAIIDALGLSKEQATPAELLARSSPESPHDTIQVVPEPIELPDGTLVRRFLVSGVRHVDEQRPERVSRAVERLEPGRELRVVPEPSNPAQPRALQLTAGRTVLGWVPTYLLDEIHNYLAQGRHLKFEVERANGPDVSWHLRLLCKLTVMPDPGMDDGRSNTPA
ncbi:MAG: helix-turn-helix domain-containing protein [Dehalococcoidia bacterium]